jgi:tetratricopeptide (TPR) repeat protein
LEEAKTSFAAALRRDDLFYLARFYLGITQTQLRETKESIPSLLRLRESGIDFDGQVGLQLAYAHLKQYRDDGYRAADQELEAVARGASERKHSDLYLQAQAMQVFLYAVMAGRMQDESQRPHYATLAVSLGEELLKKGVRGSNERTTNAVLFDIFNGLGIAWMRIGQFGWKGFPDRDTSFKKAEDYYQQAQAVRPNTAPVLQNLGQLREIQSEAITDLNRPEEVSKFRREAREFFERSLEINDHDQFPFFRLAKIAVKDARKADAMALIEIGRAKPGAVSDDEWDKVRQAALKLSEERDATK